MSSGGYPQNVLHEMGFSEAEAEGLAFPLALMIRCGILPGRLFHLFCLHYVNGLSAEEAAEQEGQHVRHVERELKRIRQLLMKNRYRLIPHPEMRTEDPEEELPYMDSDEDEPYEEDRIPGQDPLLIDLADAELSVRSYNCLRRAGIKTVGEVALMGTERLMQVRNLGRRSCEEVIRVLRERYHLIVL